MGVETIPTKSQSTFTFLKPSLRDFSIFLPEILVSLPIKTFFIFSCVFFIEIASLKKKSSVIGNLFTLPLMPSVPKNFFFFHYEFNFSKTLRA